MSYEETKIHKTKLKRPYFTTLLDIPGLNGTISRNLVPFSNPCNACWNPVQEVRNQPNYLGEIIGYFYISLFLVMSKNRKW